MKRINGYIATAFVAIAMIGCTKVEPGYVGIVVNNYGSQRGVSDFPLKTGRVWFNPFSEDVYKFPTFMQNVVWSASQHEGTANDESITFNSIEGATINADISVSYQFKADKVPDIFVKFRKDADDITNVYVRSQVRDAFSRRAGSMKVTDIFGIQKRGLEDSVKADLNAAYGPIGFQFDNVSIIGALRVDKQVESSINAVLTASQKAIEAENKVKQAQAEAQQAVATARGDSASAVIAASGNSQANAILMRSLTPELIQYQTVQKWNGVMPTVTGGQPLISLPLKH